MFYKLDGKRVVEGKEFMMENRQLFLTKMGDMSVSTIFLGVEHGRDNKDRPILFETMISGGKYDDSTVRYVDWESARSGHDACVEKIRDDAIKHMMQKNKVTRKEATDSIETQELLEV